MYEHPIKAIIFYNDGVILDSIQTYLDANYVLVGSEYPQRMLQKTIGRNDMDVMKIIIEEYNLNTTPQELYQNII
jgi:beta-phosphoglucomutase-like phosphatase (HAD superfamily)